MTTAWDTALPATRASQDVASKNTYENACPAADRSQNAPTCPSRSAQILLTSLREIPCQRPEP